MGGQRTRCRDGVGGRAGLAAVWVSGSLLKDPRREAGPSTHSSAPSFQEGLSPPLLFRSPVKPPHTAVLPTSLAGAFASQTYRWETPRPACRMAFLSRIEDHAMGLVAVALKCPPGGPAPCVHRAWRLLPPAGRVWVQNSLETKEDFRARLPPPTMSTFCRPSLFALLQLHSLSICSTNVVHSF